MLCQENASELQNVITTDAEGWVIPVQGYPMHCRMFGHILASVIVARILSPVITIKYVPSIFSYPLEVRYFPLNRTF